MSRKLLKGVQCVVGLFLCLCGLGSWVYVKLAAWETFGDIFAIAGLEFDMSNIKFSFYLLDVFY